MKKYADQKRRKPVKLNNNRNKFPLFKVGDKVYLLLRNLATAQPTFKLDQRYLGPFPVKRQVSEVLYKLDLPPTLQIHPVFHVSLLLAHAPGHADQAQDPTPAILILGQELFVPKRILNQNHTNKGTFYLVHWEGYQLHEDTWEPAEGVQGLCVLNKYLAATPLGRVPCRRT